MTAQGFIRPDLVIADRQEEEAIRATEDYEVLLAAHADRLRRSHQLLALSVLGLLVTLTAYVADTWLNSALGRYCVVEKVGEALTTYCPGGYTSGNGALNLLFVGIPLMLVPFVVFLCFNGDYHKNVGALNKARVEKDRAYRKVGK